jgi:Large eukaryotic DNA virus major capsid protein
MSHEYLIDQLQFQGTDQVIFGSSSSYKSRLNFNHPVKEIVWVLQRNVNYQSGTAYNDWFNFSAASPGTPVPSYAVDLMESAKILLNGHERFAARPQTYFRLVQPYQCHTRIPSKHIYVYAFGLRPEEHQPSGTCNFSRIDNAQLVVELTPPQNIPNWSVSDGGWPAWSNNPYGVLHIFAKNYNVLREIRA